MQRQGARRARIAALNWGSVILCQAPIDHICHFLDRKDMTALQTTAVRMPENVRKVIRARNDKMPEGKRLKNLEGPFCVCHMFKQLLKREGRYPLDMVATGGFEDGRIVNTVKSMDLMTKRCMTLAPMITVRFRHSSAVVNGKLFVLGGFNHDEEVLSSVECFDPETGLWSAVSPMSRPRLGAGAAVLAGKIFVAGGCDVGDQFLSSVESFDPVTDRWTVVAPMNKHRVRHGVVSAQGKIFAVGGLSENREESYEILKSVEYFDPLTNVWTNISPMNEDRDHVEVAALGSKLFAIGGEDADQHRLSSVECLDLSVPNSAWTPVAPMTMPRSVFGVAVTGEKIYAFGGELDSAMNSMECFDPNDGPGGQWAVMNETPNFFTGSIRFAAC